MISQQQINIKLFREHAGYSVADIAKKMNLPECEYFKKENNPDSFTMGECILLIDILGIDPNNIFSINNLTEKVTKYKVIL